jgi:hypothetical protein
VGSDFITAAELEVLASQAFEGMPSRSVARVWIDWLDGEPFVRVCLVGGVTRAGLRGLRRLRDSLQSCTGYRYTGVAYGREMGWDEIDEISQRMRSL